MVDAPQRFPVGGSERSAPAHERLGAVDPAATTTLTIYLRGSDPPSPGAAGGPHLSREDYEAAHGASAADIEAVRTFAAAHGLGVGAVHRARRSIELTGTVAALAAAFGTEVARYRGPDGGEYRGREGPLTVPAALAPLVTAVFGLDDRPQARTQFRPRAA